MPGNLRLDETRSKANQAVAKPSAAAGRLSGRSISVAGYSLAMEFEPDAISQPERYKLLIGCIVPRPIAFVSTVSPDGKSFNLAPFSFFNGVGSNPMMLLFCPANKPDGVNGSRYLWRRMSGRRPCLHSLEPFGNGSSISFSSDIAGC